MTAGNRRQQSQNLRTGAILVAMFGGMFVASIIYIMLYH